MPCCAFGMGATNLGPGLGWRSGCVAGHNHSRMDISRHLAEGVGGWLMYEWSANRSGLFNERYMAVPIANVLHARYAQAVRGEFVHPVLAAEKKGAGRRPEVDFAVLDDAGLILAVVESKWVGQDGLSADKVIWDLIRLELIAANANADAYFLLAGRRKYLESFFNSRAFKGKEKNGTFRRILKLGDYRNASLRIDTPPKDRVALYRELLQPYPGVSFTARLATSRCSVFPASAPMYQYQAYAWRVHSHESVPRFKPSTHKYYSGKD